ncbi:DoxX family protein [Segetibacter sp. 3557_3]|uniref:DoxX family protein n=1 Tax=Segetibacter sp. 3557_3 TaxID=2547429 RepID=UPI001058ABC6|nr:DoxX family protein [Segetibacter sp. 3557_3]TDH27985.1 DoxX family protein [Segetibacter sp. 3557_3]
MNHYHIVSRIAIYLLAIVMIIFGIYHFLNPRELVGYVPAFIPGGILWIYLVGAAFVLVALALITNRMVKLAGYVLATLLIIFILTIHLPNYLNAGDKEMKQIALISLLKDAAIAGFALHVAAGAYHQKLHLENSD